MAHLPDRISTMEDLTTRLSKPFTLLSIDVEGERENVSEIGLAISSRLVPMQNNSRYTTFVNDNKLHCFTIRLRNLESTRDRRTEPLRFGEQPEDICVDPKHTILEYLAPHSSRPIILVVYDSTAEFQWAADACPELLHRCEAYVDVQKLAAALCANNNKSPGLRHCLKSLAIDEGLPPYRKNRQHRATNDAVYTLAVLAALRQLPTERSDPVIPTSPKRPYLNYGRPKPAWRYPFTALIRTLDRTPLPEELDTAGKIHNYYRAFHPIAAGTGLTHKGSSNKEQLSWSWICFDRREDLDAFCGATHCSKVRGGKSIMVESQYIPGVTLTLEGRVAKQIADREVIAEERRLRRLDEAFVALVI